ncbi:hypothetical protein KKH27_10760, partial [bacterium]|nr:hypothetical protein [bacterium]MBU1983999.1 hypothetical protein [bacterium]
MKGLPTDEPDAPFAFLLQCEEPYTAEMIRRRLLEFNVVCEADDRDGVIALPCHASLAPRHVEYIFGAFRGMVNPCYTFVRKDPAETE